LTEVKQKKFRSPVFTPIQ